MVLALTQWFPVVAGWRGIWTSWPWRVAGSRVCLEEEAEVSRAAAGTSFHGQVGRRRQAE